MKNRAGKIFSFLNKAKENPFRISKLSPIIGIDLGTANSLVYVSGRGIVANEPSSVAINKKTGRILAVGKPAEEMRGKTPSHIITIKPLKDGVISDFEVAEQMIKYFLAQANSKVGRFWYRPRVIVPIPMSATAVEKKSAQDAIRNAGASEVYLTYEPIAASLGAYKSFSEATGHFVVDIGGGTTEIAVIALGGIVVKRSIRIAGNRLDEDIARFAREKLNLLIGIRSAEKIKIALGSAVELEDKIEGFLRGRDLIDGLPREILVNDTHIRKAISPSIKSLIKTIRAVLEETPPELLPDIMKQGIVLTGGGALLRGIGRAIEEATQVRVKVAEDPLTAVVRGAGLMLENFQDYQDLLIEP